MSVFATALSPTCTLDPALAFVAERVSTEVRKSGASRRVPSRVQPDGAVSGRSRPLVTNNTSVSPDWTDAGTITDGEAELELVAAAARNAIVPADGGSLTVSCCVAVAPRPALFMTVSDTVYWPAAAYVWLGFGSDEVDPSPNAQMYEVMEPAGVVEPPPSN